MLASKKIKPPLSNSYQRYNRSGISKVISPAKTLKIVLSKLKKVKPPILDRAIEIRKETGIPQYYIKGTDHYVTFVNRIGRSGFTRSSNGKGYKKTHALVSGLMEMAERYSCNNYLIYRPGKTIVKSFKSISRNPYDEKEFFSNPVFKKKFDIIDRKVLDGANIIWHQGFDLDGNRSLIPVSLITFMHEITNGMASGNSLEEALLHGICEVIERHCKSVIRDGKISPPTIDLKSVRYKSSRSLIKKYEKSGYKIILKNYSMDLGVPVVAAIRKMGEGKVVVTVGVAPHPEEAIDRALTENSQAEKPIDMHYYDHLFKKSKRESAQDLPNVFDKNIKKEIDAIKNLLLKKGMKIWYLDCTDKVLKVPAVFVFISGTKRNNLALRYRNAIVGLIEESLKMGDYIQAHKFVKIGKKKDRKQINLYEYFDGVIYCFNGDYRQAIKSFLRVKNKEALEEMKTFLHIQLGSAYAKTGDYVNAVKHFCINIKHYPVMNYLYLRVHHQFLDKKTTIVLRKIYEELMLLSRSIDVGNGKFQKEFAKNLNSYTL